MNRKNCNASLEYRLVIYLTAENHLRFVILSEANNPYHAPKTKEPPSGGSPCSEELQMSAASRTLYEALYSFLRSPLLLLLIQNYTALTLLLGVGLFGGHRPVDPVVSSLQIGLPSLRVVAFVVSALAVHQVHVCHRVVVARTKFQGLLKSFDTFFHLVRVLRFQCGTDLLVV